MADKIKPDHIRRFDVSGGILRETWEYLQYRAGLRLEGVAYWSGTASAKRGTVRHVLFPESYVSESEVHIEVGIDETMRLAERIHELDEFLLVRVHSHPDEPFHSYTDDHGCLSGRVGMISIVIPRFAEGSASLEGAAVFEKAIDGLWRSMPAEEIRKRFRVI